MAGDSFKDKVRAQLQTNEEVADRKRRSELAYATARLGLISKVIDDAAGFAALMHEHNVKPQPLHVERPDDRWRPYQDTGIRGWRPLEMHYYEVAQFGHNSVSGGMFVTSTGQVVPVQMGVPKGWRDEPRDAMRAPAILGGVGVLFATGRRNRLPPVSVIQDAYLDKYVVPGRQISPRYNIEIEPGAFLDVQEKTPDAIFPLIQGMGDVGASLEKCATAWIELSRTQ